MLLIRALKLPACLTFLHADRVHVEHHCAYTDRCFQHCTALNWVILDYFSIGLICIGSCTICVARFIIFFSKPDAAPLLCHWYTRLIQAHQKRVAEVTTGSRLLPLASGGWWRRADTTGRADVDVDLRPHELWDLNRGWGCMAKFVLWTSSSRRHLSHA